MKRIVLTLIALLISFPAFAGEWDVDVPQSDDSIYDYPDVVQANNSALDRLLSNYNTIKLSYSSATTLVASAGEVTCSNSDGTIRRMRANTSSTNITFSDIDTGSESSSTTYYIFAVCPDSQTTADFVISTSASTPTGETYYKRLGSFYNNSSSNIINIVNDDTFNYIADGASKSVDTNYQASTDGIVTAVLLDSGVAQQNQSANIIGYVGQTSPASTQVQKCYIDNCTNCGTGVNILACSISFPVRLGNYYRVVDANNTGTTTTIYFTPTGR